jgi:prepilin signal peptidase PulO-like enzyme (type II secretory pathway)
MGIPKMTTNIFVIFCVLIFLFFSLNPENLILPLIILIFFLLLNLVKKSFGIGDILVIVGLGILMTQGQYVSFFWLSVLISLVYAIVFSIVKRVNLKGMKVPMIPFISIAFVFSVVYGGQLWGLILKLIG